MWNADGTYTCGTCLFGPPPDKGELVKMLILSRQFRNERMRSTS